MEGATARVSSVPVLVRESWNFDTCPAELLPWLAWAFSVDEWNVEWTESVKREVLRASFDVHRTKGTLAAVKRIFAALGFGEIQVDEGRGGKLYDGSYRYDGFVLHGSLTSWAWYRVRLQKILNNSQAETARRLLATNVPLRAHLYGLDFTEAALVYNGVAKYDGSFNHGVA